MCCTIVGMGLHPQTLCWLGVCGAECLENYRCSLVPAPAGPARSSLALRKFRTAGDERAGPGNEAKLDVGRLHT